MATLHKIEISHFRGIEKFSQVFSKGITCIVGRGDSGKSTILDAISLVLSPSYSINFYDSDFYKCDITTPIQISATLIDLPEQFISKYGEFVLGIKDDQIIEDMESENAENAETAITIKLTVDKNLEPIWEVCSNRNIEPKTISAYDRAKLNMTYISDYSDRQFSLMKGNPLYNIYKQISDESEDVNSLIDVIRNSKTEIDKKIEDKFHLIIENIKEHSKEFGINLESLKIEIDQKDIYVKDNKVCLHEDNIPLRLKGIGSKRLTSLAIQLSQTDFNSIILIDEIEIGLEPDRVQHLVLTLKRYTNSQILFTTHSRDVIVELECNNLYIKRNHTDKLLPIDVSMQGCVRSNPEAFFAKRIIVCEGATEVGFCRAINEWRINNKKNNLAYLGIRLVDGDGNNMIDRAKILKKLGFDVCLFCDSDNEDINNKKQDLKMLGIVIIDCEDGFAIETQIFNDIPWPAVKSLIECRKDGVMSDKNVFDSIQNELQTHIEYNEDWLNEDNNNIRQALAKTAGKKEWFKRIHQGNMIGQVVMKQINDMEADCRLKHNINQLNMWIDKA